MLDVLRFLLLSPEVVILQRPVLLRVLCVYVYVCFLFWYKFDFEKAFISIYLWLPLVIDRRRKTCAKDTSYGLPQDCLLGEVIVLPLTNGGNVQEPEEGRC